MPLVPALPPPAASFPQAAFPAPITVSLSSDRLSCNCPSFLASSFFTCCSDCKALVTSMFSLVWGWKGVAVSKQGNDDDNPLWVA